MSIRPERFTWEEPELRPAFSDRFAWEPQHVLQVARKYDENQPRDEFGRWSETGFARITPLEYDPSQEGYGYKEVDAKLSDIARETGVTWDSMPDQARVAVRRYTGDGYVEINDYLRFGGDGSASADIDEVIADLDETIARSELKRDLIVYRGMKNLGMEDPSMVFVPGMVFQDAGFVSTSVDSRIGRSFARRGGYVAEIKLPKGTRALVPTFRSGEFDEKGVFVSAEQEVVLPRDSRFRVYEISKHPSLELNVVKMEIVSG